MAHVFSIFLIFPYNFDSGQNEKILKEEEKRDANEGGKNGNIRGVSTLACTSTFLSTNDGFLSLCLMVRRNKPRK